MIQNRQVISGEIDMEKDQVENQIRQFCDTWRDISMIYKEYARRIHFPYTSLYILNIIAKTENCTQKYICTITSLPLQTINTIVAGFIKKKWITLEKTAEDRRMKIIHLTEAGKELADQMIPRIENAEICAMQAIDPEEREIFLKGIEVYRDAFYSAMLYTKV